MKAIFPYIGILTALPAMATEPPQSIENNNGSADLFRLTVQSSNECILLENKNCHGQRKQLRFETPSGYFVSIEKINDNASAVPYDKTYEVDPIGNIHGRIAWEKQVTGTVARIGKAIQLAEKATLNVELYAGKIFGAANLNAIIEGTAYPLSVKIPAFSYQVGGHIIDFPGQEISTNGGHKVFSEYNYATSGKSYYGGLRESFGTSFSPIGNAHILLSQFAQAGLDRISYGTGLGIAYTSDNDNKVGRHASNICQGGDFRSSARFAFLFSACANKTKMDLLYDKLLNKAEPFAARGNARIAEAQAAINKFENKTGYGYSLPTYTGADFLRGIGIESPYNHISTSFVVAASMNLNSVTLTLTRHQPLKSSRDGGAVTSLTLGKDF